MLSASQMLLLLEKWVSRMPIPDVQQVSRMSRMPLGCPGCPLGCRAAGKVGVPAAAVRWFVSRMLVPRKVGCPGCIPDASDASKSRCGCCRKSGCPGCRRRSLPDAPAVYCSQKVGVPDASHSNCGCPGCPSRMPSVCVRKSGCPGCTLIPRSCRCPGCPSSQGRLYQRREKTDEFA